LDSLGGYAFAEFKLLSMSTQSICFLLGIIRAVSGGALLLAGALSLNALVGERSKQDGRVLSEKWMSGSHEDYISARLEATSRMGEKWRASPVSRRLVYTGGALLVCVLACLWAASPP
jgi:hypothetical protein